MGLKEDYQAKIEAQLKEWDLKIEELKAKAGELKADAKIKTEEQIQAMLQKRKAITDKLQTLKDVVDEKWDSFQKEIDESLNEIQKILEVITSQHK